MDTLPVWKRIYPIISSTNRHIGTEVVEDVIDICNEQIIDIFLPYKPYEKESFNKWKQQLGLKEIVSDDEMCNFMHILSRKLDLDTNVAWKVTCNFLMYEFYGKVDELKTLIKFDSKIEYLTENIWYFYSADRMFLLKTLRYILEEIDNKNCTYIDKIELLAKNLNITLLWKNLVTVFSNLIHEINKDKSMNVPKDLLIKWISRNNREQIEVVLLMMHTIYLQDINLTGSELEEIILNFIKHGFTTLPLYTDSLKYSKQEDLEELKSAEIALVLTVLHHYWTSSEKIKIVKLAQTVERNLETLQIQADKSIVLFAWLIFKISYNNTSGVQEANNLDFCNVILEEIIKKEVFKSIHQLLRHRMFSDCKAGEILVDAVYTLMLEFSKICTDMTYLHEQPGVAKIIAELLRHKGLVVLDNFGAIFQLSMEVFPFVFEPFLDICKSLLFIPEKYDNVIKLLKNIPTFMVDTHWNDTRQSFTLTESQKLFTDSDLFIVPSGTIVEKVVYRGNEFTKFLHPFSFFVLMEQYTKSLSTVPFEFTPVWNYYKNLVEMGFKFINHLLHYKKDYRNNIEFRSLMQRLEIVPVMFCEGAMKNLDLIKLYFEINCTLITSELSDYMEAFPPIRRKSFLPTVLSYSKKNKNDLFVQLHNKCLLYKSLKEEEEQTNHSMLIQYLKLIYFMVKKNIYHQEVQLPGVWYVINCIFPLYQLWRFDDPAEKTKISKYCFSIFIEILQRHLSNVTDNSVNIYEMILDSFLYEDIIFSYISMLSKDKFYLQILLEQESNWRNGPNLENIECLRLQLVFLLLLFKHKPNSVKKKNNLDDNVVFFAKTVTHYIINPYSLALRKLSCRFLEILARDQDIPLMALLGLDYEQVQRLYLDRLRDSTEDEDLKMHILDLIGTCVIYQHGMTAAFFNVKRSRKWYSDNKDKTIEIDKVTDFMIDYLQNVKKSAEYLRSPLQVGILHVMSNLWSTQKKHLIGEVMALNEFWPLLSNPLYGRFDQSQKVYAFIFKMYGIELIQTKSEPKFVSSVEKFVIDTNQVKLWIDYMWSTFEDRGTNIEDIEDSKFLLKCWTEFIIVLEKCQNVKKFDSLTKFQLISKTLDGIQLPMINSYFMDSWMEYLLLQVSYWKIPATCKADLLTIKEKSINFFNIIKLQYNNLVHRTRLAVLTNVQHFMDNLHANFEESSSDLLAFLEQFGPMFEYEYTILVEQEWKIGEGFENIDREEMLPWMMCVRIVSGLFEYKNVKDIGVWFNYRKVLNKFLVSTCELVRNPKTLPLTKMLLHSLALYSSSSLCLDFVNQSTTSFYVHLEPPLTRLLCGQNNMINPLQLEEGWITFSLLIKFQTSYFRSLQEYTLTTCYRFINLYEQIFAHIFNILETTVALKALDLVQNTLVFLDSILQKWHIEWYRKSNATYNFVVSGVKKVINACLYAILRPKNMVVYLCDDSHRFNQLEKIPVQLMVAIMNRLIAVAGLGFSILYRLNDDLIQLLDSSLSDTATLIIENDFCVPKFELPISNKLTYGMLLCLSHFLCKTLDALILVKNPPTATTPSTKNWVHEIDFARYFGMIEHQDFNENVHIQKLSAFLRNAYSGLADPWIQKLNVNLIRNSLECLMMFLAQQIFLAIKMTDEHVSYFKRNLSSELQFFYEHVKKTTSVLINSVPEETFSHSIRVETDILRKYLMHYKDINDFNHVADNNFCIVICYWFLHFCKLR